MTWVDYVLIAIVALSALISLARGFVREALALLGWIAAVWVALSFAEPVSTLFDPHVSTSSMRLALAFVMLFVGTLLLSGATVYLVGVLVDKTGLSGTDRLLGALFGTARGVIIAAIAVLLAGLTPLPRDAWWRESLLLPHFQSVAEEIRALLPAEIARSIDFEGASGPASGRGAPVLNAPGSG